MLKTSLIVLMVLLGTAAGCTSEASEEAQAGEAPVVAAVNASCPLKPDNAVDPKTATLDFKGKAIGFCCDDCRPKWNQLKDTEKLAKLAAVDVEL